MTPEQRIEELERRLDEYDRVMRPRSSTIEFFVPVIFRREMELNGVRIMSGLGDPGGAVAAARGSLFLRRDGAANSTAYVNYDATNRTLWSDLS